MRFFGWLFDRRRKTNAFPDVYDPSVVGKVVDAAPREVRELAFKGLVAYRPELVGCLESNHAGLLLLHGEVVAAARSGDALLAASKVRAFKRALTVHLAEEFRELYVYVEFLGTRRGNDREQIHTLKNEMQAVGITIMGIINRYSEADLSTHILPTLADDFIHMAELLIGRIQRVETQLYPIYDRYGIEYTQVAAVV